ncbi:MAG TPA: IS4 family transposase, partial [Planctomycetaceae bacterium]|nr:IS4 family transposase [Planctomycetaceae bacterium]
ESRQYRTGPRLEAVIGLTTVLSVRLLQLKQAARTEPDRPAEEVVPRRWIEGLRRVLRRPRPLATVRDFFRALASLGGFLGRKSDGEPGWQTIWHGLETLLTALRGMESTKKCG